MFWVAAVYPETNGTACMLFPNDKYDKPGRKVMLSELNENYQIIS
jgi:hypothetical protein